MIGVVQLQGGEGVKVIVEMVRLASEQCVECQKLILLKSFLPLFLSCSLSLSLSLPPLPPPLPFSFCLSTPQVPRTLKKK